MVNIRYCWSKWYEDLHKALADLEQIHHALEKNEDYANNRILAHVEQPCLLEVIVFDDSKTYVRIHDKDPLVIDLVWRF